MAFPGDAVHPGRVVHLPENHGPTASRLRNGEPFFQISDDFTGENVFFFLIFWSSGDEKLGSDVAEKNQKDMTNISQPSPYHHIHLGHRET